MARVRTIILIPLIIIISFLAIDIANFIYIYKKEEKLHARMNLIKEGMDIEEVIKILGKPDYQGEISSEYIENEWPFQNFYNKEPLEKIKTKYEKLVVFTYFNRWFRLLHFRWENPLSINHIYLDPKSHKVVYASHISIIS